MARLLVAGILFGTLGCRVGEAPPDSGVEEAAPGVLDDLGTAEDSRETDSSASTCTPTTCVLEGKNCGSIDDHCGSTISCGTCTAPESCGVDVPNICGCRPESCASANARCGTISDGCGKTIDCGSCNAPETCAADNTCTCEKTTCATQQQTCGTLSDDCGGILDCGSCPSGQTCSAGVCGTEPCVATTCAAQGKNCGTIPDGCSGSLHCGSCTSPSTCGGGGTANVCGCTKTTCAAQGKNCGTIPDGCSGSLNCGSCTSPSTCGGGGSPDVCGMPLPPGKVCRDRWCWEHPTPYSDDLLAVWGASPSDLWAFGLEYFARWDGSKWTSTPAAQKGGVAKAWGSGADDVWAVGNGFVIHWDGLSWKTALSLPGTYLPAICGLSKDDVWVGGAGLVQHWDGSSWTGFTLTAGAGASVLWCSATNDVWAFGSKLYSHWNGKSWVSLTPPWPITEGPWTAAGLSPSDVWAIGPQQTAHWDGVSWDGYSPSSNTYPRGHRAWAAAANDIWLIRNDLVERWDGAKQVATPPFSNSVTAADSAADIHGFSANDVWVVGPYAAALHWDGASWSSTLATRLTNGSITALTDGTSGDFWASTSDGPLLRWDGTKWVVVDHAGRSAALFAPTKSEVWAVSGWADIQRCTATACQLELPDKFDGSPRGVWGTAANDVWIVGTSGSTAHWDGASLKGIPSYSGADLSFVHGSGAQDVWAVSSDAQSVLRWDGSTWAPEKSPASMVVMSIYVLSPTDVWIVGRTPGGVPSPAYQHWDGSAWTTVPVNSMPTGTFTRDGSGKVYLPTGDGILTLSGGSFTLWNSKWLNTFAILPGGEIRGSLGNNIWHYYP